MQKPKALVIDIDGTLANIEHRRHFVDKSLSNCCSGFISFIGNCSKCRNPCVPKRPDWKSFNESMHKDTVNQWCAQLIQGMWSPDYPEDMNILFVTGREQQYWHVTQQLIKKGCLMQDEHIKLFMRPNKDYRPDVDIKREIYEREIKDKYDVLFCIDDRQCVVDLWRSLGLICLQCAPGDF